MWAVFLLIYPPGITFARQSPAEFQGTLQKDLLPNRNFHMTIRFDPLPDTIHVQLPEGTQSGDTVLYKRLKWPPDVGKPLRAYLVLPKSGAPALCLDINRDGTISSDERFAFPTFHPNPGPDDDLVIRLPYRFFGTQFDSFPVTFRPASRDSSGCEVSYSNTAFAAGSVNIDANPLLVQYGVDASNGSVGPSLEGLGMDLDGDGKIDMSENSPETDYGNRGVSIFHIGNYYLSTRSVDSSTGIITLASHPSSEYKRIDLAAGSRLPDFSFTDLEGARHKLSDYRGSYVLLDFWATWCAPCVAEVPFLKELHARFGTKNFRIIGMDMENGWDSASADQMKQFAVDAKAFVTKYAIPWTQASTASIAEMVNDRFRVNSYPMKLLLDPEGKIVLRQGSKGHDELLSTLSRLLAQVRAK